MIKNLICSLLNNLLQESNTFYQDYIWVIVFLIIALLAYLNNRIYTQSGTYPLLFEALRLRPIEPQYKKTLSRYFDYYKKLPLSKQRKFEKRVQKFIDEKEFIARQMDEVTSEMKVLISASAIQLTFGLPPVFLVHFKRILVYPDTYFSTINQQYHKGEVNPNGQLIVLSWKNFLEGYIYPHDSHNLGLHEMAHALLLENRIRNHETNFLSRWSLKKFFSLAELEIQQMNKSDKHPHFRGYGAANRHEFFAVAIETFFENPSKFRLERPKLYRALANILRQDPCKLYC